MTLLAYVLATLAVILVAAGLVFRNERGRHVPLMIAAFILDTVGLLIVEFSGQAVENLQVGLNLTFFHAIVATIAYVGYIVQIVTGRRLLAGRKESLAFHKIVARVFIVTRLLAYVTMFYAKNVV